MRKLARGLSIILPVHWKSGSCRELDLLRGCLESIRTQEIPIPFETLVIDDGSAIPVAEKIAELPHTSGLAIRPLLRRHSGIVAALNAGLAAARYDLVARIDADDEWLPGKIHAQLEAFERDPSLTLVATGMIIVDEHDEKLAEHIRPGNWPGILKFARDIGNPFPHGSVVARTAIHGMLGGYSAAPDCRHCEDYELWARWIRFFPPAAIEQALYKYRQSAEAISSRHMTQQNEAAAQIMERFGRLSLGETLPESLAKLARSLGITLTGAGALALRMWNHRVTVRLPMDAAGLLQDILPDRRIRNVPDTEGGSRSLDEILWGLERPVEASAGPRENLRAEIL